MDSNNILMNVLMKSKPCFGKYENWDNSWHCHGCIIKSECDAARIDKVSSEENEGGEQSETK